MAKYTQELKLKIVNAYLNNEVGYRSLAKRYGIKEKPNVRKVGELVQLLWNRWLKKKNKKPKILYPI